MIITAFAPVKNVNKTLTPELKNIEDSILILIDLGAGKNRLGGSILAQVYNQIGVDCPDVDDPTLLKAFFNSIQTLNSQNKLLSYHDRSDGGLLATVTEMMFASRIGVSLSLDELNEVIIVNEPEKQMTTLVDSSISFYRKFIQRIFKGS